MNPRQVVRLLLVEPHRLVHTAVERLIRRQKLPYVLETAASRHEALRRLRHAPCDAVLLDCTAGGGRGWEIFEQAQPSPVILLVDRRCGDAALGAPRRGACPCPVDTDDESSWNLLPAVVETAVVENRVARKHRPAAPGQGETRFRATADAAPLPSWTSGPDGLAHELQQPLSAIAHYARACRYQAQALDGEHRDLIVGTLARIAEQADRAGRIIRSLRDFVRRADCRRAEVDLNELIRESTVLLDVPARSHDVRLELILDRALPRTKIDRTQIQQVVTNLIRNAVEAVAEMPQPRRIVTIRTSLRGRSEIAVAVEDKGAGLNEEDVERLFEPFYSRKADGMGLGLSISRSLVEAHGGRLEVQRGVEEGATLRFTLPLEGKGGQK